MAAGELQQDITAFEYSEDVERYMDRIGGKTASLFATAAEGGAIVTGASEEHIEALRHYGESLGMAFQIVDDLLDATQSAETLGKRPSDAALDKSTYVGLYGLEEARNRAGAHVDKALEALRSVGIDVPALNSLTLYIVEREK